VHRDVAIIGAGYVGIPLAQVFADAGLSVLLVDVSIERVEQLNRGESYIEDVSSAKLKELVGERGLRATTDYDELREADAIVIALPTPLSRQREPDLSIVRAATEQIATRLRAGHLVVLESTTYPGTTRDELLPILERGSGLTAGVDFHLAFSPERIDPGNRTYGLSNIPKIVGGVTPACRELACALYGQIVERVVPVSSPQTAEMVKLFENIFRSVNIALVNELAIMCRRLGLSVWEIIDAAATKPFGFMPFYPGPGIGGHCLPSDPYYLSWRARMMGYEARLVLDTRNLTGALGPQPHVIRL
jgi:UDP-N-acetyl-D-glucosamine dehydrogenase